jgi:hypothetical protein
MRDIPSQAEPGMPYFDIGGTFSAPKVAESLSKLLPAWHRRRETKLNQRRRQMHFPQAELDKKRRI